jgi:ABC-type Mn2+/Zn2+ transport system permease subunit
MIKRLTVWISETAFELVLLGVFLAAFLGHDRNEFMWAVLVYAAAILMMFVTTGYLLTTVLARAFWKGKNAWSYPCAAVALFFLHFEIMNVAARGAFDPAARFRVRIAGAVIALLCSSIGTVVLRRWSDPTVTADSH